MKKKNIRGRPQKHKEGNTFKFKSFNTRVAEVSVDSRLHLRGSLWKPGSLDSQETNFQETFTKWTDLNRTQHFTDFQRDVRGKFQSLRLVVHHKEALVDALIHHITVPDSLALEPLLELIVSLANDLCTDFYKNYFERIFAALEDLFLSENAEILEWTFSCLAKLFGILRRQMTKDLQSLESVFRLMKPFFEEGQKEYVVRFATESFAFLLRDCKKQSEILDILLCHCVVQPSSATGLGQLLFESVKNVNHHLHSVFEKIFPVLLEKLREERFNHEAVEKCVSSMTDFLCDHVTKETVPVFWNVFLKTLESGEKQYRFDCLILQKMTEFKKGWLITEGVRTMAVCSAYVLRGTGEGGEGGGESVSSLVAESAANLLLCQWMEEDVQVAPRRTLVRNVFSSPMTSEGKLQFVRRLVGVSRFRMEILPFFLDFCLNNYRVDREGVLLSLVEFVLEKDRGQFGGGEGQGVGGVGGWEPLRLEFGGERAGGLEEFCRFYLEEGEWKDQEETLRWSYVWAMAVLLPHFRPRVSGTIVERLVTFLNAAMARLKEDHSHNRLRRVLGQTVHASVIALVALKSKAFEAGKTADDLIECLRSGAADVNLLSTLDVVLSASGATYTLPTDVVKVLHLNLRDSSHAVRRITLRILDRSTSTSTSSTSTSTFLSSTSTPITSNSTFTSSAISSSSSISPSTSSSTVEGGELSVYKICLLAELVEPSVHDYREKLRFLRMLDYSQKTQKNEKKNEQKTEVDRVRTDSPVPLLYLFGSLKIGFQLLWKEVKELIVTYRPAFFEEKVWSMVEAELRLVSQEAEAETEAETEAGTEAEVENGFLGKSGGRGRVMALMDVEWEGLTRSDSNPLNAHKYRVQLWQTFAQIVGVDTTRNRIYSELFQRFMRNEFLPVTLLNSSNEEEDEGVAQTDGRKSTRKSRGDAEETVCAMLELLSKLNNPAALHQDPIIRGYLFDLLTYRTAKVQMAALKLLLNYKLEYIRPYEEYLMKLLDENEIWNTLAEIEFGASNPVIKEQHRSLLVPLIIRILFGRMQTKNKSRNTDKAAPRGRKEAIVRTLANCRPEEFQIFLNLILQPCSALLEGPLEETMNGIMATGRLPAIHLKLADGVLQTLYVILDELRSGSDHCIHTIYRAIIGILAVVVSGCGHRLAASGGAASGGSGLLKKLRKECYRCLVKMCSIFSAGTFFEDEKKVFFDVGVWPEVQSVRGDGLFAVTPLMRLLLGWSQQVTYHDWLAVGGQGQGEGQGVSLVGVLVEILNPQLGASEGSVKVVVEVIDHLLYPEMLGEGGQMVEGGVCWSLEKRKAVLTPYAGQILKYLQEKLTIFLAKKKRKNSPLTEGELRMAAGMSELSLDEDESLALLNLLLPLVESSEVKKQKDLLGLLDIVQRLVGRVPVMALGGKMREVACLMSKEFPRDARTVITRVFCDVAQRVDTDDLKAIASTASNLLSWNPRHIEEPDYELRGRAYQEAKVKIAMCGEEDGDVTYALVVLHIADYDVRKANDIMSSSLRELGLICILAIIRRFAGTPHSALILSHVTPLVKEGLKNKVEAVRNSFISVLGEIVDFYPNHALFRGLRFLRYPANKKALNSDKCKYCDSEGGMVGDVTSSQQQVTEGKVRCRCYNSDLDVFENLRHMQKHRVGGAFHDVALWCLNEDIAVSTMVQFFVPLAGSYLCNEQYGGEKYQGVIGAVIELIGAVARRLQWGKYEGMMKHYLMLMKRKVLFQKQLMRVVLAVVDAFHFDLLGVDLKKMKMEKRRNNWEKNEKNNHFNNSLIVNGENNLDINLGEMVDDGEMEEGLEEGTLMVQTVVGGAVDVMGVAKAEKIYRSLTQFIIPGLTKLITDKAEGDNSHKLTADVHAGEKEEILRAPVALAVVKLLQKLPVQILRREISGVFLKIARMLKSRLLSVRDATRETLSEIMVFLGPLFLNGLIKELKSVLKRGYQIHVLVHCVHMILVKLEPKLKSGDLDKCLGDLVDVCKEEMFGELAEEKEVSAVTRKIFEAKNVKAYDMYTILARLSSPGVLVKLIQPLRQKAQETQTRKVAIKLEKAFRQILIGLVRNEQLTERDLLLFAYALYDQSMGIFADVKEKKGKKESVLSIERPDAYLIVPEPGRAGPLPASNRNTNDYLVEDFGLQILLSCLRNGRLQKNAEEDVEILDPFFKIVFSAFSSRHNSVKTTSLRCFLWMVKFNLPSLKEEMENVKKTLFVLLKNYSGPGAAVGQNKELVNSLYKALSFVVRFVVDSPISDEHLKVLLTYAERDLQEGSKQILAFNLLKAVLSRQVYSSELRDIMMSLAKTSIQGEEENLRQQSRHLVTLFLMTYNPKIKKIQLGEFVELFKDNLEYPLEHGRLVCVAVLSDLVGNVKSVGEKKAALELYPLLAARLSDEMSPVRHKAADAILTILQKCVQGGQGVNTVQSLQGVQGVQGVQTGQGVRSGRGVRGLQGGSGGKKTDGVFSVLEEFFKWTLRWLGDEEMAVRQIGFQTATLFVQAEKAGFLPRLRLVLPALGKAVRQQSDTVRQQLDSQTGDDSVQESDHLLINALSLLAALIDNCGGDVWRRKELPDIIRAVEELLLHEHEWVRIRSLEVFWKVFQQQTPDAVKGSVLFAEETERKVSSLVNVFVGQLKSYSERDHYYDMWAKCMMYVVQVLAALELTGDVVEEEEQEEEDEEEEDVRKEEGQGEMGGVGVERMVSLPFAVRGVCREAVYEALHQPKKTMKRFQVVKWIHGLCDVIDKRTFQKFLPSVLQVLYRCTNEPSAQKDEALKRLTEEVTSAVESHVGREVYADVMREVILRFSKKRADRKRQQAVEPILNPEKVARKKIKKQLTKKETRKRRTLDVETGRLVKKSRPR